MALAAGSDARCWPRSRRPSRPGLPPRRCPARHSGGAPARRASRAASRSVMGREVIIALTPRAITALTAPAARLEFSSLPHKRPVLRGGGGPWSDALGISQVLLFGPPRRRWALRPNMLEWAAK